MWAKIDAAQLRGWQAVVNFLCKHTGRNQFDIAKFLAVLYVAGNVPRLLSTSSMAEKIMAVIATAMAGIAALVMFVAADSAEQANNSRFGSPFFVAKDAWFNSFNRAIQTFVMAMSALGCLATSELRPLDFAYVGMWGYWYVMICDPPPPPQERESVENLATRGA